MTFRILLASIATLTIWLAGCSTPDFDGDAAKSQIEGAPFSLTDEQVTLNDGQVTCGAQNELWDPPNGNMARLTQKGRDLKFSDDVRLNDPEIRAPYIQVSGAFPLSVYKVVNLRDNGNVKLAEVKLGVVIQHDCFTSPLPLMGVKKGKFSPDAPVVFQFQGSGKEWTLDKLLH